MRAGIVGCNRNFKPWIAGRCKVADCPPCPYYADDGKPTGYLLARLNEDGHFLGDHYRLALPDG